MRRTRAMLAPWHLDAGPSNAMAETLDALCRTHHTRNDARGTGTIICNRAGRADAKGIGQTGFAFGLRLAPWAE